MHSVSERNAKMKYKCTKKYNYILHQSKHWSLNVHSASGLNASFLRTAAGAQKQLELAAAAAAAEATAANEPGPRAVQCNPVQTTKS